ncbi:MAG: Lon-like protease helical domain-containing protein, partial [Terriglobia bacterium]
MSTGTTVSPPAHTALVPAPPATELTAEQLRFRVTLPPDFLTTAEITPGTDFIGQERARAALELGLGIPSSGFNIFVSGLTGAQKLEALRTWVARQAQVIQTPGDWVYVQNFVHPDAPRAIPLAAGQGCHLKHLMSELLKTLREEIPKAFRQEAFDKEKAQLKEKYAAQAQALNEALETRAREKGFQLQGGAGGGIILIPIVNDKPLESPEEFTRLTPEQQREIEKNQREFATEMAAFASKQQEIMRAMIDDVRQIERRFGDDLLAPLLARIRQEMANPEVNEYLKEVEAHIIEHLDDFKEQERQTPALPFLPFVTPREEFLDYEVNVVVDNSSIKGAPVLVESSPTYLNLFGT